MQKRTVAKMQFFTYLPLRGQRWHKRLMKIIAAPTSCLSLSCRLQLRHLKEGWDFSQLMFFNQEKNNLPAYPMYTIIYFLPVID